MGRRSQEKNTGLTYEERVTRAGGLRSKLEIDNAFRRLKREGISMLMKRFRRTDGWHRWIHEPFIDSDSTS